MFVVDHDVLVEHVGNVEDMRLDGSVQRIAKRMAINDS